MPKDLHVLPKVRDGWTYLYVEHARIDRSDQAIVIHDQDGRVPVPCATLALLMVGPGTTLTHAAVVALSDNGCLVAWVGESGIRFYAQGMGETRSSAALIHQARLVSDPQLRLQVVFRLYQKRFEEPLSPDLTLRQIRGLEGARVRGTYSRLSQQYGLEWKGRYYDRQRWMQADPLNRALSVANSCLYGVCHAAIVSIGLSPGLGFIHTGKMLSFVYDVADLYKTETTIPVAFAEASKGTDQLETRVRRACRDVFHEQHLLGRIVSDLDEILDLPDQRSTGIETDVDSEPAAPGELWDPATGAVRGGRNFAQGEGEHP
ncbi:type I-E CRISPR-associated endonuclease Cas1e [Carboxydochorda subterranea]|uniref:CRISPR-associated endonuclease Cas1 n=1 Tax=Carboxydichorda subterranea TaxID=3109565 RepID=A0ABZ1BUH1_9FIRM|nr:type I-E CRISPR-associated endonuclease Cas1e [Limnochorda sp. L945t]WRP16334.1 type I-E CRISPR-associated endonuclease Cas1e [Limnochorda sp. L945t]